MPTWRVKTAKEGETCGEQHTGPARANKNAAGSYKAALLENLSVRSESPSPSVTCPADAGPEDLVQILRELHEQDRDPSEPNLLHALEARTGRTWQREELMHLFDQPVYFGGADASAKAPPRQKRRGRSGRLRGPGREAKPRPFALKMRPNHSTEAWWDEPDYEAKPRPFALKMRPNHSTEAWWDEPDYEDPVMYSGGDPFMYAGERWADSVPEAEHRPGENADRRPRGSSSRWHQAEHMLGAGRTGPDVERRPQQSPPRWHQAPKDSGANGIPGMRRERQPDFSHAPRAVQTHHDVERQSTFTRAAAGPTASQTASSQPNSSLSMDRQLNFTRAAGGPTASQTSQSQPNFSLSMDRQPGYNQRPALPHQAQPGTSASQSGLNWLPVGSYPQQPWSYHQQAQGQPTPVQQSNPQAVGYSYQQPNNNVHQQPNMAQGQPTPVQQSDPQSVGYSYQQPNNNVYQQPNMGQLTPCQQPYQQPNTMAMANPSPGQLTPCQQSYQQPNAMAMANPSTANPMMQQQVWVVPQQQGVQDYYPNNSQQDCYPSNSQQAPAVFFAVT